MKVTNPSGRELWAVKLLLELIRTQGDEGVSVSGFAINNFLKIQGRVSVLHAMLPTLLLPLKIVVGAQDILTSV